MTDLCRVGSALVLTLAFAGCAPGPSDGVPSDGTLVPDSATAVLHYIERPIGTERYRLHPTDGGMTLASELAYEERGSRGALTSTLMLDRDNAPLRYRSEGNTYRFVNVDVEVVYDGDSVRVGNMGQEESLARPEYSFPVRTYAPVAARAALVAYWLKAGRPAGIRPIPGTDRDLIQIEHRGVDTVTIDDRTVVLDRYSVDGVVWGREAVWLDEQSRFAALLTRIHVLPLEAVRSDLVDALPILQAIGIQDRLDDLRAAARAPVIDGTFALVGPRLIDGSGGPVIEDAAVVVEDGRIADVGPRSAVEIPNEATVLNADGYTVLPGLWDTHGHVSQIEWAEAYLRAGVTTVVDVGGEAPFLTAFRDVIDDGTATGPRLILAGLIDGGGASGFGMVSAATVDEGRSVVDRYEAAGFRQIKLYGGIQPDVVRAITARAHELGLPVTGHVPTGMTAAAAIEAGLDGVTHLRYALQGTAETDLGPSIERLSREGTVVSPAVVWGELLGRSSETPIEVFEPGINHITAPLALNYHGASRDLNPEQVAAENQELLGIVAQMHEAGVVIAAGTDAGVPGYSLLRELELYVEAGLSPMEAIGSATRVAAEWLGMDADVGTVTVGKRADLLVVEGDPLTDITQIRAGKWVVTRGRLYETNDFR